MNTVASSTAARKRGSRGSSRSFGAGRVDQLVIGRHAVLFRVEGDAGLALESELDQLDIAVAVDRRIDLARHQRRHQVEIDVDQRHVLGGEPRRLEDGVEIGVLQPGDRIADLLALEVGERLHRPVLEHDQAVERRVDQRAEAHQRQALLDLQHQVGLVGDGDIGLAGGDQPRRRARIGRRDQIDVETVAGEIAALLGDDQRRMVGIDEPVEQHRQLVGGLHLKWNSERQETRPRPTDDSSFSSLQVPFIGFPPPTA